MVDNLESRENSFRKGYSVFLGSDVEVLDGDDDVGGVFLLGFVSILVRAFKKSAEGPAVSFLSGPHVKMTLFFPSQSSSSFAASFHLINQERVLFFGLAVFEVGSDV